MKNFKLAILSSLITFLLMSILFAYFYYNTNKNFEKTVKKITAITSKVNNPANLDSLYSDSNKVRINKNINVSLQTFITETVKKVSPAIVGINVTEIQQYRTPWSQDPFFRQFFGDILRRKVKSLGSGAIISPDGYIITNDHVAGNATKIIVTMTDGSRYNAKIIGTDKTSDICLLKIDGHDLPYIKFGNSNNILIGEWVIAFGNPFGLFEINDKPTVTVGVVSATGMNLGSANNRYYFNMIQTDAAINSGNSGGALVNSLGQIIGMNTLIYSQSGGNVGVGFAIPINKVKKIVADLKAYGKVDRNFWTGLSIQTITPAIAKYYGLKIARGVIITNVMKNSPASKADIQIGDIITRVNNYVINDDNTLIGVLQEFRTNDIIRLTIKRKNETLIKMMKLERRK